MKNETYTLSAEEAKLYDGDDQTLRELDGILTAKFGKVSGSEFSQYAEDTRTEVYHPDGFVIDVYVK